MFDRKKILFYCATFFDKFLDLLNKQYKNTKVIVKHGTETLSFLDVKATITEFGIETKIYRKPIHINLLLNLIEFIPLVENQV